MKKLWYIALKDISLTFRDSAALMIMLGTPILLTLVMAFALGGSGNSGIENIPMTFVNQDEGQMSGFITQALLSDEVADLLNPTEMDDPAAARAAVDRDEAAAAVIIPNGLSDKIMGQDLSTDALDVEIYTNPTRPIGGAVVRAVVDQILNQLVIGRAVVVSTFAGMLADGSMTQEQVTEQGPAIGQSAVESVLDTPLIEVESIPSTQSGEEEFDWVAYMAPSMALLFLMFTVTSGGRSILDERGNWTLQRMLVSPTHAAQVLGGKIAGIFFTGYAQMLILFIASWAIFRVVWGPPLLVLGFSALLVLAATGWGTVIAAFSKTPGQVSVVGAAVTLIFGAVAGTFFPRNTLPGWLQTISLVSPNAWGIDGFTILAQGGGLIELLPLALGLLALSAVLFATALFLFRRQYA